MSPFTQVEWSRPMHESGIHPLRGARPHPAPPRWRRTPGFVRALLGVSLFYKIVIANALLIVLGAAGSFAVARHMIGIGAGTVDTVAVVVAAVVGLSVVVNAVIVRLALSPLAELEETAARVQAGDLDARATMSPLADEELARVVSTFNAMLESVTQYRHRLREVAKRAQEAAEDERKRISRELHDETAQTLAALMLRLRLARGAEAPELRETLLEEVREEIAKALEGIRRFAQGLRPPALDMLGLSRAVEGHARELSQATGLPIEVRAEPVTGALEPESELALYRVVQEALSNVVRHAHATRATVTIERRPASVHAVIEDDGRGFAVAETLAGEDAGLGLFGMRERAAYVGGEVKIESRPGGGTRVDVEIPTTESVPHV